MATTSFYPVDSRNILQKQFIGKSLQDIPVPAAVIDLNKVQMNCSRMLEACKSLDLGWRAHIKTHKTTELTRLQVGDGLANVIVSTIIEAEHITPLLLEYKSQGRAINLLYSFPVAPSSVARLTAIAKALGNHGLALMIDHPDQLASVTAIHEESGIAPDIFLKIDMGTKRAGVSLKTKEFSDLSASVLSLSLTGHCHFLGLYAHAGQSYYGSSSADAVSFLVEEFQALLEGAQTIQPTIAYPLVLSVGATPTTTSIWNLTSDTSNNPAIQSAIAALKSTISEIREMGSKLEVHAGVYTVLDLQQLSTHAVASSGPHGLTLDDIALTIIAEVASVYPGRGENATTEALVGAGTLALGREPCKNYPGWAILTPWNRAGAVMPQTVEDPKGWIVGVISQEHGILQQQNLQYADGSEEDLLNVGQKVRIWPNHACVAGAGFGWYYVVDGSDTIVDIWVRWRGW
ncbi:putative serine dehydratase domain-containing protein [Calycina marina]|uniref:D-serine dehydratase n=1 Tax=Calycina marina TaxID=1763456 RepID=A0A9P7YZD9_9HELO|nr:putative serine dehydratase domain-containing protein [Calycina marina]